MKDIEIDDEFITLGQLLKLAGAIGTGGEAKFYLAENTPVVNGEEDARRGRKIRVDDEIELPQLGKFKIVKSSS